MILGTGEEYVHNLKCEKVTIFFFIFIYFKATCTNLGLSSFWCDFKLVKINTSAPAIGLMLPFFIDLKKKFNKVTIK